MTSASLLTYAFFGSWATWGVLWIVLARWSAPSQFKESGIRRFRHAAFVLVGSALLIANPTPDSILGRELYAPSLALAWAGVGVTVAGMAYTVWARVTLGTMWSGRVTLKEDHHLVESGPYGITRHPIYTGLLTALLGTAMARGTVAAAIGFAALCIGFTIKLTQEEELLEGHLGAVYVNYRRRVKGLIPFVW